MMQKTLFILSFLNLIFVSLNGQDSLRLSGQVSSWLNLNSGNELPLWGGGRYIPQFNYSLQVEPKGQFDSELSANIYGSAGLHPFDTLSASGSIKPYRAWIRYSSDQFEIRLGLQKLSFGSATMLRPLMWFDQLDPRDPLQLTDGVWGALARYYFLNNSNIWLWGLYGNNELRGWELIPVNGKIPEFGGRIQLPVPAGEIAFTYHHRVADTRDLGVEIASYEKIPENKFGFDAKWDMTAGIWFEGSYTNKRINVGMFTNQLAINAGIDYTFALGSGLYIAFEQLVATYDEKPFTFTNSTLFSLLSVNYPVGLFDRLGSIIYYNWTDNQVYTFLNWQKQFDNIMFYVMTYWNPEQFQLPSKSSSQNIFAGRGIQLMFVFNY
jgi:hypothetical protein